MKYAILFILFIILVITSGYIFVAVRQQRPILPLLTPVTKFKVIGWIPNWDQQNAIKSYTTNIQDFQYVSVFWYRVTADGKVSTYAATQEDPTLITTAHAHHDKIFALVANLPDYAEQKDWDAERVQKVIGTENARQQHIHDLLALVTEKNFDGIDIDYEALHTSQKNDFSLFIAELAAALHAKNKLLGVAIYPPSPDSASQNYGPSAQDIPVIANAADQLYFMTYLEHTLSSSPGPTGGIPWITQSVDYAINTLNIPRQKIYLGIGLMGTAWRQNPDGSTDPDRDDITFQEILSITQSTSETPSWDDKSQSPYLVFNDQNGKHIVWFENSQSVAKKISFAKDNHLGGIAFWRLGGEDPAIWQNNLL